MDALLTRLDEIDARWSQYFAGRKRTLHMKRAIQLASGSLAILVHNSGFGSDFWVTAPPAPTRTINGGICELGVKVTEADLVGAVVMREFEGAST